MSQGEQFAWDDAGGSPTLFWARAKREFDARVVWTGARNTDFIHEALGAAPGTIRSVHQVHSPRAVCADELQPDDVWGSSATTQADSIYIDAPGASAAVKVADCIPLVILGTKGGASVGMVVHAGWKGVALGVVEQAVGLMDAMDTQPQAAAIGPSIRSCCLDGNADMLAELGSTGEVRDELPRWRQIPARDGGVHPPDPQLPGPRIFIDLPALVEAKLRAAGVKTVDQTNLCTACDLRWFSYRADGPDTGRQLGALRLGAQS